MTEANYTPEELEELKKMEQEENLESSTEKSKEVEQSAESKIEETQKDETAPEKIGQSSEEINSPSEHSGKFRALKRFFVRSSKGRRVLEIGEEVSESELQPENISDGLVERI